MIWNVFLFAFWSFDIISLYIISGYHFWYVLNLEIRQPKTTKDFFATNPIFLIWMAGGVHRFMGTAPQFFIAQVREKIHGARELNASGPTPTPRWVRRTELWGHNIQSSSHCFGGWKITTRCLEKDFCLQFFFADFFDTQSNSFGWFRLAPQKGHDWPIFHDVLITATGRNHHIVWYK